MDRALLAAEAAVEPALKVEEELGEQGANQVVSAKHARRTAQEVNKTPQAKNNKRRGEIVLQALAVKRKNCDGRLKCK